MLQVLARLLAGSPLLPALVAGGRGTLPALSAEAGPRAAADRSQQHMMATAPDGRQRVLFPNLPVAPRGKKMTRRGAEQLRASGNPGRISLT